jgi:hypothetical protein
MMGATTDTNFLAYQDIMRRQKGALIMSTLTAESILKLIEQLPPTELIRLNQLLAGKQAEFLKAKPQLDRLAPCEPMKDRTREMKWIEEHKHEYVGQWVALDGDRLIVASPIRAEISAAIKADGAKLPLIHRITSPDGPLPIDI